MKNKLILIIVLTGLLLCSSFRADNDQVPTLTGTKWVASGEGTTGEGNEKISFTFNETLSFTSDNTFLSSYDDSLGEKSDPKAGTYVYSQPNITLTFKEVEEGDKEVFSGTINGNVMTISGITFIKQ